ncbi:DUF4270 family protein [Chryseobacterium lactis]|uniref:DUF4270 family protein n=1 Tax=Chryseobacterium lactis TaxID=1241981 RepID=UPI0009E3B876|nr:DUF4270 family protein [Chryseobacterium lactis]
MTHTLKRTFAMLLLAIFGSTLLYNCEPDPDALGEQLFNPDAAQGTEVPFPVIAYNINNNDSIRSDASRLISGYIQNQDGSITTSRTAILGAFTEGQFGTQKASYITQLRMPSNFANDFGGANAKVDSVVLVLRMPANTDSNTYFQKDSLTTTNYEKSDFLVGTENVAVNIEKKTYPVYRYGKAGQAYKNMKINVNEITTFLDTNDDAFKRSNANVGTGELLGSGTFDGNVSALAIKRKSDGSDVFTGNLGFRMKLSNTDFFQTHILDKKGKPELSDPANFIRYFKGIKISVDETDRYLFQISPDDTELIMYYKYDKTENGTTTRPQTALRFNLASPNAHIGKYDYNRSGSAVETALMMNNTTTGDSRLFVQGMGGPSVGVQIQDGTINDLKALYASNKIGIVGAKIRLYVDPASWNYNNKNTTNRFTIIPLLKTDDGKLDLSQLSFDTLYGLNLYNYNSDKKYYDFVVTKTIKAIVEGQKVNDINGKEVTATNKPFYISMGSFIAGSSGKISSGWSTSRAVDMNRVVLVGSDASNANKAQLIVTYGTKK